MLSDLEGIAGQLRRHLSRFDAARVTTAQAASVLETAAEMERLAGSLKVLAAARAAKSRKWSSEGHRSPAGWLAEKTKGSYGEAISTIETSQRLADLPDTAGAIRRGELSRAQATEVAAAASRNPRAEQELLEVASQGNLKKLRDRARQVVARAGSGPGEIDRYRAIHRKRYLRHWSEVDGAFRLDARLTPDSGARLLASIQDRADMIFQEARKRGEHEPPHAYEADALVALVSERGAGPRKARSDSLVVRIDAGALRRGHVRGAETCEISGVGPVPVATARRLLGEAFVKLLVKDGVDVTTVCHVGRTVSAHLQSALEERDPVCVVPSCQVSQGLENHHWVTDYADCGTTSLAALARVCGRHHDMITYEGFRLVGGPGHWKLHNPRRDGGDSG